MKTQKSDKTKIMLPRLTNLKKQLFPRAGNFGDKILILTFSEVHFRKSLTFSKVKLSFSKKLLF